MAMTTDAKAGEMLAEMNTTPLIDVMLVLLTLLIITLPMQTNAVKITMPTDAANDTKPVVVDVGVEFDGTITWNGRAVDRATLDANLVRAAQNPATEVHIRADRLAKYDTVAKVLADTQRTGIAKIGFPDTAAFAGN
jgi:biopolymer transport protein ExbD